MCGLQDGDELPVLGVGPAANAWWKGWKLLREAGKQDEQVSGRELEVGKEKAPEG